MKLHLVLLAFSFFTALVLSGQIDFSIHNKFLNSLMQNPRSKSDEQTEYKKYLQSVEQQISQHEAIVGREPITLSTEKLVDQSLNDKAYDNDWSLKKFVEFKIRSNSDFEDLIFDEIYLRCIQKSDFKTLTALREYYLSASDTRMQNYFQWAWQYSAEVIPCEVGNWFGFCSSQKLETIHTNFFRNFPNAKTKPERAWSFSILESELIRKSCR